MTMHYSHHRPPYRTDATYGQILCVIIVILGRSLHQFTNELTPEYIELQGVSDMNAGDAQLPHHPVESMGGCTGASHIRPPRRRVQNCNANCHHVRQSRMTPGRMTISERGSLELLV